MKRGIALLVGLLPLWAFAAEPDPQLAAGRKAAQTLVGALVPQLKAAMQAGGPEAAVSVCAGVAQQMTTNLKVGDPMVRKVTRITNRPRNPVNLAKGQDLAVIKDYLKSKSKDDRVVSHDDAATYYKPLYVQELCLNCHGPAQQLKPEVQRLIRQHYPNDQATGYAVGDLRGLIKVELNTHNK